MIRADQVYQGHVGPGCKLIESSKSKTPGFQIFLQCADGDIDYIIWITPKNKARAIRDFEVLGVEASALSSRQFILYQLPQQIGGKEVAFGTKSEVWQEQSRVKVAWIGKPGAGDEEVLATNVAKLFADAAGAPSAAEQPQAPPPTDEEPEDDIPF